jgi:hypothetical protein
MTTSTPAPTPPPADSDWKAGAALAAEYAAEIRAGCEAAGVKTGGK